MRDKKLGRGSWGVAVVLAGLVLGIGAFASGPTLKSIVVDGDMADWAPVLSNPLQYTQDGTYANPCGATSPVDLDCVNGYLGGNNNGSDITGFAWTYDANNIYLYLRRASNPSTQIHFLFAMDVNHNTLMESTDYVLDVQWFGSSGSTPATLYRYVPLNPSGDAITSGPNGTGTADGYRLPGSLGTAVWTDGTKSGGSTTSPEMEAYVPWIRLGVPYGTPIYFHVSSNKNSTLSAANDDLGGPGGGLGAFGFHGSSLAASPASRSTPPGGTVSYDLTLTNTGTFTDDFALTATSSMGYGASLSPASVSGLAAGASVAVTLTVPTNLLPPTAVDTTMIQATCGADGSTSSCTVTTYVGSVTLASSASETAVAGSTASYPLTLTNLLAGDRFNFSATSSAGFRTDLYAGGTLIATSLTGNGTWDSILSGYDQDANGQPDVAVSNGASQALTAVITPPSGASTGTVDTTLLGAQAFANGGSASVALTTTVQPRLLVTPSNLLKYAGSGTTVYFAHALLNSWDQSDSFTFSPSSSAGFAVTVYSDPNGDGNPADGAVVTGTGPVAANGGLFHFVVAVTIPPGTNPPTSGVTDTTTVTVTSVAAPLVSTSIADQTKVSFIAPFQDALHTLQTTAFGPCAVLYIGGFNLVPATNYGLVYKDPGGATMRSVPSIQADAAGTFGDSYTFPAGAAAGSWTVTLLSGGGASLDSIAVAVQRSAGLSVRAAPLGSPLGGSVLVASAQLANTNAVAPYAGTRVNYVVKDPTGSLYLQPGGTFAGYVSGDFTATHQPFDVAAGASAPDTLALGPVTYPAYGIYSVCATWEASCGSDTAGADDLASTCSNLYVVSWGTFADSGGTTPQTTFSQPATVYLQGQGYADGTPLAYQAVIYGPAGYSLLSATSASSGLLAVSLGSSSLPATGSYEAVVYPSGVTPPAAYNASDPNIIAAAPFTVLPPTPVLSAPTNGGVFTSSTVSVSGTGAAPGSTVNVYIDGTLVGTTTADGSGGYSFTYTFTGPYLGNGSHSVYVTSTDTSGVTSAASVAHSFTVNLVALLRFGGITSLSPLTPASSTIFTGYPGDPSLPTSDWSVQGFNSGSPFPQQSTDLASGSPPLVFYQLAGSAGSTLRVVKSGGVIAITY